jgi:hypothetical protein
MTDQIVVLGWDGLDVELLQHHGVVDAFGDHRTKLETYVNERIGEPHTKELWPTMITGLKPPAHGIRPTVDSDNVQWNHAALRIASRLANGVVPEGLRSVIGRRLEARGAAVDGHRASAYETRGLDTVFGPRDRAISIPNYRTPYDENHGLDGHRTRLWHAMNVDRSAPEGIRPTVDIDSVQDILGRALGRRLGHTLSAMQSGAPIVWTWFGYLDSVGHIAPTLGYPLESEAYEVAAAMTALIRSVAGSQATVLSVSDHGLQDGEHTHYATLASDNGDAIDNIDAVWDVADWIQQQNAEGRVMSVGTPDQSVGELNAQLEALGYT